MVIMVVVPNGILEKVLLAFQVLIQGKTLRVQSMVMQDKIYYFIILREVFVWVNASNVKVEVDFNLQKVVQQDFNWLTFRDYSIKIEDLIKENL